MNYRQRVPKALTTPLTIGGGSKKPVIFNGVLAMVGIFATGKFFYIIFFIILSIILHGFIVWATKKDPQWFEVLMRYLKKKKKYRS